MSRLIDADVYADKMREKQKACEELIKEAGENKNWSDRDHWQGVFATFVEAKLTLDDTPTIEAEPVKHGRWIDTENNSSISGYCSSCGWKAHMYEDDVIGMPYCPNCGARMDEEA